MRTYTPDRWTIIEISSAENGSILKILASWYGGFASGDSWKLSSGIETIQEFDNRYEVINSSGSLYVLFKGESAYGMSGYSSGVFMNICEQLRGVATVKRFERDQIEALFAAVPKHQSPAE